MVALAGGCDVLERAGAPSDPTTWETVREHRPNSSSSPRAASTTHARPARRRFRRSAAARSPSTRTRLRTPGAATRRRCGTQLAYLIHPELLADPGLPYVELDVNGAGVNAPPATPRQPPRCPPRRRGPRRDPQQTSSSRRRAATHVRPGASGTRYLPARGWSACPGSQVQRASLSSLES